MHHMVRCLYIDGLPPDLFRERRRSSTIRLTLFRFAGLWGLTSRAGAEFGGDGMMRRVLTTFKPSVSSFNFPRCAGYLVRMDGSL